MKKIDVDKIKWENFDKESIKLLFDLSQKMLAETIDSMKELTTKSYIAIGFYSATISYSFLNISETNSFSILFVGTLISTIILIRNLFPYEMFRSGLQPRDVLVNDYFISIEKEEKENELYISKILSNDDSIDKNINTSQKRVTSFNASVYVFISSLIISFLIYPIFQTLSKICL